MMPVMPQMPSSLNHSWISNRPLIANRLYAILCCMVYWLNAISSVNTLAKDFKDLLDAYPNVDVRAMGFPEDWKDEPLWK